jgi:hypothetical protein
MLSSLNLNNKSELDLKEWHSFISSEVRSGNKVLGENLSLPLSMGLTLEAMIHVMRRHKVLNSVIQVIRVGDPGGRVIR